MRRREFITLLGGAAIAWPLAARAQQLATPVIGYLSPRSPDESPQLAAAFHRGLKEIGLVESRDVAFEYRYADNRIERIAALAVDLAHRNAAVIAALGTVSARAAKAATTTIPIVFLTGDDPIAAGLVSRLDRPDRNLTGVSFISATLGAKRVELLRALVPKAGLIAVLVDQNSPESRTMSQGVQEAAKAIGQPIVALDVSTESEINVAFASLPGRGVRAALVAGSPFNNAKAHEFVAQAARNAIVTMYTNRDAVAAGGLISYGASIPDAYRQTGNYTGRIIRGESVVNLPVLLPTKFEFVLNLSTAKALGLDIPPMLLALADEVIE